jgi:hypothetical protein
MAGHSNLGKCLLFKITSKNTTGQVSRASDELQNPFEISKEADLAQLHL